MRNEPTKLTENGVAGGKRITHGILANKRDIKSEQQVSVLVFRLGSSGRGVGSGDGGVGVGVGRGARGRTGARVWRRGWMIDSLRKVLFS